MFSKASSIESICWQMRLADYDRSLNRSKINDLANGFPPYTPEEVTQNNINFNFSDLSLTKILQDARRQFQTGLLAPDPLFTVDLDYGPVYRRRQWANTVTKNLSRIMKRSRPYRESQRSTFAADVAHGIGPSIWQDCYSWRTKSLGIEDVLLPSGTLLEMDNVPFIALYRQWTGNELQKLVSGPNVDPGWDIDLAEQAVQWVDQEAQRLLGQAWADVWSPEKMQERIKEDSGLYSADRVPTVDAYDFYFWHDDGKRSGWQRRIVLDAWGTPGVGGVGLDTFKSGKRSRHEFGSNRFLYDSSKKKNPVFAPKLSQFVHFQFADCSSVAPFRYHSVRSLGFLLWTICNIQNRVRCKFTESAWESMMQYLRSNSPEDAERALAINLVDKRVLPAGIDFVKRDERWEIDGPLVQALLQMNRQTMADNSASFTQDYDFAQEQKRDETATRTMAKVNSTAALVGAMLDQAYSYQKDQYEEICRRFSIKNSRDGDVREFRLACLKDGVPEEALCSERWIVSPNRIIGAGNKTMQGVMMDKVMAMYDRLNPEAQQDALRLYIAVNTDDYDLANRWVPEQPHLSDSVDWANGKVGTMMEGVSVPVKPGVNVTEVIETWLHSMATIVSRIEQEGGNATKEEILGLQTFGSSIGQAIHQLAQDKTMKQRVKIYGDDLGKLMNLVKAYAQRLAESQQQQNPNGQIDPVDAAKINAINLQAQTKAKNTTAQFAQKHVQRQIAFQSKQRQEALKTKAGIAKQDLETAANIRRNGMSSFEQ